MKKFRVVITSAKDVNLLNDKIAIDSLFTVGETITNNPLHVGVNVVTDERIKDSMRELANKRGYCTNKDWMTFDDGANPYMWAIDTICSWFPDCNKEELEKELDMYI